MFSLSALWLTRYNAVALLLYDTILTFDREVSLIWARGRAHMTMLFLVIRDVEIASLVLYIAVINFGPTSAQVSLHANDCRNPEVALVVPYFGWAVFLGWRAYALSSRNIFVGLFGFLCSVTFAAPTLVTLFGSSAVYSAHPPSCTFSYNYPEPFISAIQISRPMALVADLTVLVLTCIKTRKEWPSLNKGGPRTSLASTLFVNGVLFVSAVTVLHVVALITSLDDSLNDRTFGQITLIRDVVITIVLSRYILDLATVAAGTVEDRQADPQAILTTQWTHYDSDVTSLYSLDEEYNGRGFDKSFNDSFSEA
ncbi:hypothetical protein BD310DRAFT_824709 [Dichomitus squalens]|uniref:DUF6533 domain-containing protein n=1 Tax=Dichomitus squalens TaxID=114155 RepID=A0A4V2K7F9_9APHY|nr:hypothetical protein BD310DRAFT_824709 [Dichomitus squalens]